MDRLICGDAGFGKTEVAMRAAFIAVMDGRQVAILVPTTILAEQHWNTFSARFKDYPVRIEMVSRFRSPKENKAVVDDVGARQSRHRHRNASPAFQGRSVREDWDFSSSTRSIASASPIKRR